MTSRVSRVRVTCLCDSIRLPDLGITLRRGDSQIMSEMQVEGSKDLSRAVRSRAVKMTVFLGPRRILPNKPPKSKPIKPTPKPHVAPPVDVAALLREAAAAALDPHVAALSSQIDAAAASAADKAMGKIVEVLSQMKDQVGAAPAPQPVVDPEWLEAVVRSALASSVVLSTGPASDGDMPMFIPSGMADGIQGDVGTVEESSTGSGVDEAREALKALRKKKRDATDG